MTLISLQKLNRAMYLGKLGIQIVIKSKKRSVSFPLSPAPLRNAAFTTQKNAPRHDGTKNIL